MRREINQVRELLEKYLVEADFDVEQYILRFELNRLDKLIGDVHQIANDMWDEHNDYKDAYLPSDHERLVIQEVSRDVDVDYGASLHRMPK